MSLIISEYLASQNYVTDCSQIIAINIGILSVVDKQFSNRHMWVYWINYDVLNIRIPIPYCTKPLNHL